MPNPGDPQALNRYSYVLNNPLKHTDPTGHSACMALAPVGPAFIVCQLGEQILQYGPQIINLIQQLTIVAPQAPALVDQVYQATSGAGSAPNASSVGSSSGTSGSGGPDPNDPWFRNARTRSDITQSVLDKIRPDYFSPNARFGRAFYVAQQGETALAEVEAHGSKVSQVIRYHVDLSQAKVLDLTDSAVAKAWGYIENPSAYSSHQALAQRAIQQGYNVIKYASYRGPGSNLALLDSPFNPFNYDEWLIPLMVSPGP